VVNSESEEKSIGKLLIKKSKQCLILLYLNSVSYKRLANQTKKDYLFFIKVFMGDKDIKISSLDTPKVQKFYNSCAEKRGVPTANHVKAVMSRIFNFGISIGECSSNPFTNIERISHRSRKEVWTKDHLKSFLDVAYSRFAWRSVGLIVQMAYTWCQRLTDMSNLKWENYNLDTGVLKLEQSKRRARVELPTPKHLHEMLVNQHGDVGFDGQPYIAPKIYYGRILSKPYDKLLLGSVSKKIKKEAGLPDSLWIMDMRRTGTTEMVDAGVPLPQIMAVTGHSNAQSLTPYMKNTLTSATEALTKREEFK